ncbi:MAG TPA: SMC-Scp complex subunit ScpB [Candidatus Dormibacteraeota bacterium]|nr:SMC-Scp complex subunit ScpB [Candidatus Dormibacteraeota bacterium]
MTEQPAATADLAALRKDAEAVLFSVGAPMETRALADALEVDLRGLEEVLAALALSLQDRGLMLQRHGTLVQLATRPETATAVRRLLNPEVPGRLSAAAYETLAIIAYRQPLTKAAIEEIRGVDSERVLEGLLGRSLIEEVGRLDQPGQPRLFGTTLRFLQLLGMESVEHLPGVPQPEIEAAPDLGARGEARRAGDPDRDPGSEPFPPGPPA